ncbi:MAG: tetratricopeptide repeat protein [Bryobacterales bacterium]|nr:tetratricopeptide repeat protein [Bryobacterales bacterium]
MRLLALALALAASPARDLYERTEYRAALAALKPEASADPAVWHLAGRAHFQLGEQPKAIAWFEKAAAAEPKNSEHLHWLGKAWGRRAENASFLTAPKYAVECRRAFERAVEVDPKNTEAWADLLEYYLSAPGFLGGGLDKAARAVERIAALDPVEKHFAEAKLAEARKDLAGAEQHWKRAAELSPRQAGRWIDLAQFYARQERAADADAALERAAQAEPTAPKVWFARAQIYAEAKRNPGEARALLTRYLAAPLTPDDPPREEARVLLRKLQP